MKGNACQLGRTLVFFFSRKVSFTASVKSSQEEAGVQLKFNLRRPSAFPETPRREPDFCTLHEESWISWEGFDPLEKLIKPTIK